MMRNSTFSGVMMARHRGAVMTRYKTHTEIQLEKVNATLTKLLAAQLETNRLLAAYFAPVDHDPAPGAGQPAAGFTQITLDDLLDEAGRAPGAPASGRDSVWADLGYGGTN